MIEMIEMIETAEVQGQQFSGCGLGQTISRDKNLLPSITTKSAQVYFSTGESFTPVSSACAVLFQGLKMHSIEKSLVYP